MFDEAVGKEGAFGEIEHLSALGETLGVVERRLRRRDQAGPRPGRVAAGARARRAGRGNQADTGGGPHVDAAAEAARKQQK